MDAKTIGAALVEAAQGKRGELDSVLETLDERELSAAILTLAGRQTTTKRDAFAMAAMQGLLANPGGPVQRSDASGWNLCNCTPEEAAGFAADMADALLSVLSNSPRGQQ